MDNLPRLQVSGGVTVEPNSAMFHFHADSSTAVGTGFDILYGNAKGALRAGTEITIVMSDGVEMQHVPVLR
jgi:hypothetical protein